jgi:hypothetical protein
MEWLLFFSVLLNILFLVVIAGLVYAKGSLDADCEFARAEWRRCENMFYEAQGKLLQERNLFIAPTMGEFGKMIIKEHKDT